jgi:hypothetical protein
MAPHIPVWDKSGREDGTFSSNDFTFDREPQGALSCIAARLPRNVHSSRNAVRTRPRASRHERKKVEMRFAHLKTHHRVERMRLRGLSGTRRVPPRHHRTKPHDARQATLEAASRRAGSKRHVSGSPHQASDGGQKHPPNREDRRIKDTDRDPHAPHPLVYQRRRPAADINGVSGLTRASVSLLARTGTGADSSCATSVAGTALPNRKPCA